MRDFDAALTAVVIVVVVVATKFIADLHWEEAVRFGAMLAVSSLFSAVPRLEDRIERLEDKSKEHSARWARFDE